MSSDTLDDQDPSPYLWNPTLDPDHYAVATYRFESWADPRQAALAIAREQSATTPSPPMGPGRSLEGSTARLLGFTVGNYSAPLP